PAHTFSGTGYYTVCLYIYAILPNDNMCYDSICTTIFVEGPQVNPCDSLMAAFTFVSNGLNVLFTNLSTVGGGLVLSGSYWNFGDPASGLNNNSNLQNPSHIFSGNGFYTVCLIVTAENSNGLMCADTICQEIFVEGPHTDPCDSLNASFTSGPNGLTVAFNDASTTGIGMSITSWSWNFGDPLSGPANTSSLQNPAHTFSGTGYYTVCLYIYAILPNDNMCYDSICTTIFVEGLQVNPCDSLMAAFTFVSNGLNVLFTNLSTVGGGLILSGSYWNFGDPASGPNNTSNLQNPSHTFSGTGFYNVCLVLESYSPTLSIKCYDTICQEIFAEGPQVNPCDSILANYSFITSGLLAQFTNTSTSGGGLTISGWHWNFGDVGSGTNNTSTLQNPTHTFSIPGVYAVCLIITAENSNGLFCADTICRNVAVNYVISIGGSVSYDNPTATALSNTTVILMSGTTVISTTTTDGSGQYTFGSLAPGTYTLSCSSPKKWGGVNAVDALLILKHFVGVSLLTGVRLTAADVDASGYINAADALFAMKRFVGLQNSFLAGDWAFEKPTVTVEGSGAFTVDIKALCVADVNASYNPANAKPQPTVTLERSGTQTIDNQQLIEVPVSISEPANYAALSLVMNYPGNEITIEGVKVAYDNQNLAFNTVNGELRIAWCTLNPVYLKENDVLLTLLIRQKEAGTTSPSDWKFDFDAESNLADYNGNVLFNKVLTIPSLMEKENGFYLNQNNPNPFSSITHITYSLPKPGNVSIILYDIFGKQIAVLKEGLHDSGTYQLDFNGQDMVDGVYFYRITYKTEENEYIRTRQMVIAH
ncbi:MAG: PKD domain-containing protein, partial [Bacteroidetes bacterium]|nr:PKD domain-containing protein [Bacteroidota bacterium]